MMQIVGGTYLEFCQEPKWSELFGSGLRAAVALSKLIENTQLSTYISNHEEANLKAIATTFGINLNLINTDETPQFHYFHNLSKPKILPNLNKIHHVEPIKIEGDVILRFGFIEGDSVVSGNRVVYDPQSPSNPRPFHENGSMAEHLAIIANQREILLLSKKENFIEAGRALIELGAEVVVIKHGALGATVITKEEFFPIPAFRSSTVFPIGSGDIFSAVFAYHWGYKQIDPVQAASLASKATAYYCNNRSLPLSIDPPTHQLQELELIPNKVLEEPPMVYIAGPFFSTAQRWIVTETRTALINQGLKVFSPFHDIGHGVASNVVSADLEALKKSHAVIALLDGLDSGTVFEVGFARALGIPVIGFVQNETSDNLKMLEGTNCLLLDDFASAVYNTVWESVTH